MPFLLPYIENSNTVKEIQIDIKFCYNKGWQKMDFDLLHRIYHFPGVNIPDDQEEGTCAKLADLFVQFSKQMVSI